MGMFKEKKQGFQVLRSDELMELKKKADAQPKTNPLDALKVAIQQGRNLAVGNVVTVKFDPNDRKSFVLLDETYAVRDQFGNVAQFAAGAGAPA